MHPAFNNKITTLILIGTLTRLFFIIYLSQFQTITTHKLSVTDIDYKVYTDAAYRESPYLRHTYRYTPLLAYMMAYNHVVQYAGKLFFLAFDILAMVSLALITRRDYQLPIVTLYSLNPLLIYLTVRGSCESITLALMFLCFRFIFSTNGNTVLEDPLNRKKNVGDNRRFAWVGYLVYGLWVHFRIYPIIFLPLLLIHQYKICSRVKTSFLMKFIQIGLLAGGLFFILLAFFTYKYGFLFIEETYLYHFSRLDNRHSFSPLFYQIYLSLNTHSVMRSVAQLCVVVAATKRVHRSLSPYYAHFVITYAFVSFNKVITMQYYMWIFGALLLVLPESSLMTNSNRRFQKSFSYIMQYSLGILLWVWCSIKLEKQGENVFNLMWAICIGKLFSDLWAMRGFMSTLKNKQAYQLLPDSQEKASSKIQQKKQ